jgi:hypothetical protein
VSNTGTVATELPPSGPTSGRVAPEAMPKWRDRQRR